MTKEIKTKQSFKTFIQNYINEKLDVKPNDDEEDDKDLLLDDQKEDNEKTNEPDDEEIMKQGDVETEDIIEKLNTIRSGRSFRDSSVKEELEHYVDELDTPEKTALFALLKGIAQIVTKEIPANDATEPSDPSPNVEMKKQNQSGNSKSSVKLKPTVIKTSTPKKDEEEELSPIKPIKKA